MLHDPKNYSVKLSILSWLRGKKFAAAYAWADLQNPLGYDWSSYQGITNAAVARATGARFLGLRKSIGYRTDDRFAFNWATTGAVGFYRMPYHALIPSYNWKDQYKTFISGFSQDDKGELPPVLDVERRDGMTNDQIAAMTYAFWSELSSWYGDPAIIYSSAHYVNLLMSPARSWYNQAWWWLAQYLLANPISGIAEEHPGPVLLPAGVNRSRVLIHQTAGKGQGGVTRGVDANSKNLDYNRWQFDLAHLVKFAKGGDPAPVLTDRQRIERLEVAVFGSSL